MSLLASSRQGQRSGVLPWVLVVGSAASLSANVAVAEPSAVGRLIAARPSAALIGAYELLMRQIRQASARDVSVQLALSYVAHTAVTSDNAASYEPSDERHTGRALDGTASYDAHALGSKSSEGSYDAQTEYTEQAIHDRDAYEQISGCDSGRAEPAPGRRRPTSGLQRQAWHWAQANGTPTGDAPVAPCSRWEQGATNGGAVRLARMATQPASRCRPERHASEIRVPGN
jgi:hypothetical protein